MLSTLKIKIEIMYTHWLIHVAKTKIGTQSTKKRNNGNQQRDSHPTQGYARKRNYIQMTCIINMVKKQYN